MAKKRVPDGSDDVHRTLYESLLAISYPPLAPEIRNALMKVLGRSPRRQKAAVNLAVAATLQHLIDVEKARMKKEGKQPRGGRHEAALSEVAHQQGMTVDALKKRIQRHRPHPKR
jgi:hypothetical protein